MAEHKSGSVVKIGRYDSNFLHNSTQSLLRGFFKLCRGLAISNGDLPFKCLNFFLQHLNLWNR